MSELKVVMFTDQVKSTASTARRTHAQIEQVAREQRELTEEVLRLTHGKLLKDTGDGCFAEFRGVLEAAQAGMVIQERVTLRNNAQSNQQACFEVHIGIDVGELVVFEDGDLRGDAANRCARICSECPPGQVYLSDAAARMLKKNELESSVVGAFALEGVKGKTKVHRVTNLYVWPESTANPFVWREGITRAEDFFNREKERRLMRTYLRGRQNCQIVDPRRLGKTSLLRLIERDAAKWEESCSVAYLDLQHPRCFTLSGWLERTSKQFGWSPSTVSLEEFAERVEVMLSSGAHAVLCLDGFEEVALRRNQFTRDFFSTLRACGQLGLSIITASQTLLSTFTSFDDMTSPFYNTFPVLYLRIFSDSDAADFVTLHRPGIPSFTAEEREAILALAKGHPLALQVGCFHVLQAKLSGESLAAAMHKAGEDIRNHLPGDR